MVRVCGWSEIVLWVKIWGQVRVKSRCSGAGVRGGASVLHSYTGDDAVQTERN